MQSVISNSKGRQHLLAFLDSEVESLRLGAMDFILKPILARDVVLARVRRAIELSEDRSIIRSIERDQLTGLYNKEFFFQLRRAV